MGMLKNYKLRVLELATDTSFGQEVLEWAIDTGAIELAMNDAQEDADRLMRYYDNLIEAYRSRGITGGGSVNFVKPVVDSPRELSSSSSEEYESVPTTL